MTNHALLYGIDIGGTKIGLCVGDAGGRVLAADRLPNHGDTSPTQRLTESLRRLEALRSSLGPLGASAPAALGVACPGPLDYAGGKFLEPPNMPAWQHFPVRDFLAAHAPCPIAIMNDANALALAEWHWGAARGADTAVFLTMSTGMGAGLIVGGRLFEGPLGLAGEIGHIRLRDDGPVGFGKRGSVEGYCSGPGMLQVARAELLACRQTGEQTLLAELEKSPAGLTVPALCQAARSGDAAARRAVERCAGELGRLLALLTDLLNPDVIVLGTIGAAHPELFIPTARRVLDAEAIGHSARHVRLAPSALPDRGNQSALAVARHLMDAPQAPPAAQSTSPPAG